MTPVVRGTVPIKKILVADEEKHLCETLKNALIDEGYHVVLAVRGGECLEKVRKENFDLMRLAMRFPT